MQPVLANPGKQVMRLLNNANLTPLLGELPAIPMRLGMAASTIMKQPLSIARSSDSWSHLAAPSDNPSGGQTVDTVALHCGSSSSAAILIACAPSIFHSAVVSASGDVTLASHRRFAAHSKVLLKASFCVPF